MDISVIDGVLWRVGKSSPVCIATEMGSEVCVNKEPGGRVSGDLLHVI